MRMAAMAGSRPHSARDERAACIKLVLTAYRRRSSVVEHVIGNDGVGSSILPGGTINQALSNRRLPFPGFLLTTR
jgi:hypothetical protein